jgi:hypothetical protein
MPPISGPESPGEVHRNQPFGVYLAPMSLMMVAAWVLTIGLRRFAARFGFLRYVLAAGRVCARRLHDRALVDRDLLTGKLAGPEVVA